MNIKHLAIVGLGSIGARHLRLLRSLRPDIEITLVRSGLGLKNDYQDLANNVTSTIEEAIKLGVEAAIISSPSNLHLEQAAEFLKSNIPLLIEKPLSKSINGIDNFISLVEESKVPVLIGYVLRYRPDAMKFKSLISDSSIGKISSVFIESSSYLPNWRPGTDYLKSVSSSRELGGGVLLELSHELDYMNWLFGECRCVNSILRNTGLIGVDVEDQVIMSFITRENVLISTLLDFSNKISQRKCIVVTDKGEISWNLIDKSIFSNIEQVESKIEFEFQYDDPYIAQLLHFFRCIEESEPEFVGISDGIRVMNLVNEVRETGTLIS